MLVTVSVPELGIRDVNVRKDLRLELEPGDFVPVIVLELHQHALLASLRTVQEPLILFDVETTIGLESRIIEKRRRRVGPGLLDDFFVTDANTPLAVFL